MAAIPLSEQVEMGDANPSKGVCPEMEVLLRCAQAYLNPQADSGPQLLLDDSVSQPMLLELASAHGMAPILYRAVAASPDSVPKAFWSRLQAMGRSEMIWALHLTKQLVKLLDDFESRQIPAVAYKGPVLAASAYGDIALRGFRDLDIIVHKRDMFRARDALLTRGYAAVAAPAEGTPLREDGFQQLKSAWRFVHPKSSVPVDLQWRATAVRCFNSPVERDNFWETLEQGGLAGKTVRTIPAEALLQILCLHGCRHLWERLIWVCDVAALIQSQPTLDWSQLMADAKLQGNQRVVLTGVLIASRLLGAQVPRDVLVRAEWDHVACRLANEACHRLQYEPERAIGAVEGFSFHLQMLERFADRVKYFQYLLGSLVTPNSQDRAAVPIPGALSFLYYSVRPLRLILTYGLMLLRLPAKMFVGNDFRR